METRPTTGFTVDAAVELAHRAHDGQLDKGGKPYITHPVRVMRERGVVAAGEYAQMAAVLHDVIEDTPVGADDLRAAGVPERVVEAVIALSKLPGEPLEVSIRRAAVDPIALIVKRADIADNRSEVRLGQLDPVTQVRLREKYRRSVELLEGFARKA